MSHVGIFKLRKAQIGDPKMDSGCLEKGEDPDDDFDFSKPLSEQQIIWLMDELTCREVRMLLRTLSASLISPAGSMAQGVPSVSNPLHFASRRQIALARAKATFGCLLRQTIHRTESRSAAGGASSVLYWPCQMLRSGACDDHEPALLRGMAHLRRSAIWRG